MGVKINKKTAIIAGVTAAVILIASIIVGVIWYKHNSYQKAMGVCKADVKVINDNKQEAKKLLEEYQKFLKEYPKNGVNTIQKALEGVEKSTVEECGKDTFEKIKTTKQNVVKAIEMAKKDFETAKATALEGKKKELQEQVKMLGETYKDYVDKTTVGNLTKSVNEIKNLEGVKPVAEAINKATAEAKAKKDAHDAEEARKAEEARQAEENSYYSGSGSNNYSNSRGNTNHNSGGNTSNNGGNSNTNSGGNSNSGGGSYDNDWALRELAPKEPVTPPPPDWVPPFN